MQQWNRQREKVFKSGAKSGLEVEAMTHRNSGRLGEEEERHTRSHTDEHKHTANRPVHQGAFAATIIRQKGKTNHHTYVVYGIYRHDGRTRREGERLSAPRLGNQFSRKVYGVTESR